QTVSIQGLIPGANAALSSANMQNAIRQIVTSNQGEVRSSQALPPSSANGFEKLEIAYDIALPINRLKDVIYQLEGRTPYFFLDQMDIRMPPLRQLPGLDTAIPKIEIHWIVRGYRWAGTS